MTENSIFRKYEQPLKGGILLPHLIKIRGHQCESCKNCQWLGKPINLQVHHIDGDELNSDLSNLQILCPNCHALTDNYKGKNINSGLVVVSDEDLVKALNDYPNIRQALMAVGLTGKGGNYVRANELIQKHQIQKYLY